MQRSEVVFPLVWRTHGWPESDAADGAWQDRASLINQAYATLRCPYARAVYMLHKLGVNLEDQTSDEDAGFMMEVPPPVPGMPDGGIPGSIPYQPPTGLTAWVVRYPRRLAVAKKETECYDSYTLLWMQ